MVECNENGRLFSNGFNHKGRDSRAVFRVGQNDATEQNVMLSVRRSAIGAVVGEEKRTLKLPCIQTKADTI